MNLLQLEYFIEIARCENITKAAQKLHVAQPTLSQMIQRLESELNCQLFDRSGKKLKLNEEGKYLLDRAVHIMSYMKDTQQHFTERTQKQHHDIYLCMQGGHVTFKNIINDFSRQYPQVRFHIQTDSPEYDTVLRIHGNKELAESRESRYLLDDEIHLLVSASDPLAQRKYVDVIELKNRSFINSATGFIKDITEPFCKKAGFMPDFRHLIFNNSEIQPLIESGEYITFWPKSVLSEIVTEQMAVLTLRRPTCHRSLFITYPQNRALTHYEKEFIDYAQDYLADRE